MSKAHWPLVALLKSPDKKLTPVQIQKTIFLFAQNIPDTIGHDAYKFKPYNYGPFDPAIYRDLEGAIEAGHVEPLPTSRGWDEYRITALGERIAQETLADVSPDAEQYISRITNWVRTTSFRELLTAIYKAYPAYAKRSVFNH